MEPSAQPELRAEAELEAWIDERLLAFQSLSSIGGRPSIEEFAAAADGDTEGRARLLERLRRLRKLEGDFATLRDGPIGPGTDLDDFEVLEVLGQGGMGRVFRARQKSLAREVALKVPLWGASLDPATRARFLREAQAVAQLRHPHIVPLHQVGEHRGEPFLVFEFVEARSLAEILSELARGVRSREGAALGCPDDSYERVAAELVVALLEALEAAHALGIVHRDVKPGNVLLEHDGRVRVVDFGLAHLHGQESLTGTNEVLGTTSYLAPETVHGAGAAGPWSDLYAAGVVLYELLALQRPFEAATSAETLARIERAELTPLAVSHRVPSALSAIVEKAMARDLGRRYSSARDFAEDLRAYLEGREVMARPSTRLARLGRRAQRHPVAAGLGVVALVVGALFLGLWRSRAESRAQVRRNEAQAHTRAALLWWYADGEPGGFPMRQSHGRDRAIEDLVTALELDPELIEARVELAQELAQRGRTEEARRHLAMLERDGLQMRALAWTRAMLKDPARRTIAPDPGEALDKTMVQDLDRLAWARHYLRSDENEKAMEVLRPIEPDRILGPVAQYLQFEACHTRKRRDAVRAQSYLMAALVVVPDHPLLLANLSAVMDQRLGLLQARSGPAQEFVSSLANLKADLAALLPRIVAAESEAPWLGALWIAHGIQLARSGDFARAESVFRRGLAELPGHASLTHQLAQTRFQRWSEVRYGVPSEEFHEIALLLERAAEDPEPHPEVYYDLTYAHYLLEDCGAVLFWSKRAGAHVDGLGSGETKESARRNLEGMVDWAETGKE